MTIFLLTLAVAWPASLCVAWTMRGTEDRMVEAELRRELTDTQARYEALSDRFRRLPAPWYGAEPLPSEWPDPDPDDPFTPADSPHEPLPHEEGPLQPLETDWQEPVGTPPMLAALRPVLAQFGAELRGAS